MAGDKRAAVLIGLALAALTSAAVAVLPRSATGTATPAHVRRGADVEARATSYIAAVEAYAARLRGLLERDAPDLIPRLDAGVETHGYQVRPAITADPAPAAPARVTSTSYSWPLTERRITDARARLEAAQRALDAVAAAGAPSERGGGAGDADRSGGDTTSAAGSRPAANGTAAVGGNDRRRTLEAVAAEHNRVVDTRRRIERHVRYNRFWQAQVPDYRARFDRRTVLHDAAVERQALVDRLRDASLDAATRSALVDGVRALTATIDAGVEPPSVPSFVRARRPSPRVAVLELPVYSDIEDRRFLADTKAAVESAWHLRDGENEFRVELVFRRIPPAVLYRGETPPAPGARIELDAHVNRFPTDGAVLTTGAASTHAYTGRYVALGPATIARNVLAHEFGHLLGFTDRYFRGYRDLGEDGYEMLEIDSDPEDIMSEPATGRVQRAHFDALLRGR